MNKRAFFVLSAMRRLLFGFFCLILLLFTLVPDVHAAGLLYAKSSASGTGDCSTWANACTLQTALAQAVSGDEIWVAAGVHYPGTLREDSFAMKSGVAVYGGFTGTETLLSQRDWFANPTVLSGDIDHNDTNTDNNFLAETPSDIQGANAYHVLIGSGVDQTAIFDGFIINAGQATLESSYHNQGGGVYLSLGNPTLNNLVISANTSNAMGGGLFNDRSTASLSNIAFRGNSVTGNYHSGAGMFNHLASPILSNVLFSGNNCYEGGGLFSDGGNPTLINATFSGNYGYDGGAVNVRGGTVTLVNAIIWGNNSTIALTGGTATVTHSIVQGGYTGEGNLDVDPLFVDAVSFGVSPTTAGDYHLRYGSITTDIGLNTPVITTLDLDGNPRVVDGDNDSILEVDLGAYEQLPGVCGTGGMLFVDQAATGANTGLTWSNAFTDLQTALASARNCQVWVAKGVYFPTDTTDRTQAFLLRSGVQVYGGFAGTETLLSQRDWFANPTVLSGDIDHNDTNTDNNFLAETPSDIQGANAYHVLIGSGVDQTAIFDGFIINAGQATLESSYHNQGGGVYLSLGNPTLNNLVISANTSNAMGGGLFNDRSTASLSNIAFRGNSVTGNYHSGAGMFNHLASPILSNVLFSGNNCYEGGGLFSDGGNPTLINATFSGNYGYDGGAVNVRGGTVTLVNAIIWGNNSTIALTGGNAAVTHSIVQGGYTGEGNLDVDPLFVDWQSWGTGSTTAGDYHLRYGSITTDIGLNTPVVTALDLDGNPRVVDGDGDSIPEVDLGAYEQLPGLCGTGGMLFVDQSATGTNTGLTWSNAFTDLQTALASARNCQVWVAKGVYFPTDTTDRTQAFLLRSGVQIYGGFAGTETLLSQRDWFANPTVLSGDIDNNDTNKDPNGIVPNVSDIVGANAYHVLVGSGVDQTALFDGFIINAGQATLESLYHNQGGGVYLSLGNPTLNNLVISANTSNAMGGGLFNDRSTASLSNIAFRGNSVTGNYHSGAGMFNHLASPILSNVLFSGNNCYEGGGLFSDGGNPTLINATFSGNYGYDGGAVNVRGGTVTLVNAIIWGNNSTIALTGGNAAVTHSIVQGGYTGEGNLDVDPLFVDWQSWGTGSTTAGDYHLRYGSITTDIGLNTPVVTALDLDGNPRVVDGDGDSIPEVDLGAYEQLPGVCGTGGMLFVNQAATGANTGLTWSNAFTDLQTALASARNCQVWVAKGVYFPTDTTDRTQAFLLRSGVQVYGGFAGTETLLSQRDWFANPTVLSGDIDHNDTNKDPNGIVPNVSDIVGANAYHVLVGSGADQTALFDGFIINAGQATLESLYHNQGGGVYLSLGNPTLNNLVISANTSNAMGGGLFNDRSTASLSNIAFRGNLVTGNYHSGAGMFNHLASPILSNVLFSGNNCYEGGGLFSDGGNPTLINATFSGNYGYDGGAVNVRGGTLTLANAIIWGNNSTIALTGGTATVTHSIVQGGYTGEGNLDVDPLFVDWQSWGTGSTTAGDYHLRYGSPAIDVGNNIAVTLVTDLDGNPRLVDGDGDSILEIDLGTYERQAYTLTINVVGSGNVILSPVQITYGYLEQVTLTANADSNWNFSAWSGDVVGTDNPLNLTIKRNTTITATFVEEIFTICLPLIMR